MAAAIFSRFAAHKSCGLALAAVTAALHRTAQRPSGRGTSSGVAR
ncbi:MAG TPA: hypothetical protein VK824_06160 [Planctomycetota bacterium]|nr:hypothetical protein [Planctomycetota bacterium]